MPSAIRPAPHAPATRAGSHRSLRRARIGRQSAGGGRDLRTGAGPRGEASIGLVHIRRALLLFAIVLGLAAIAASVSRSPEDSGERESQPAVPSEAEQVPSPSVSSG